MSVVRRSPRTNFGTPIYAGQLHIDNSTAYSKITVNNSGAIVNAPGLRYSEADSIWEFSNDGITWVPISSGVSGSANYKVIEFLSLDILAEIDHTLPNGQTYTMGEGKYMSIYFNGQLLSHDGNREYDYVEINSTTVKFHFEIPAGAILTYIV
ncbi:hypothetical protein LCGC14_0954190 [marine sediment metagenome]|uniref:Uncharacterized protein n=1 Tax=marine sediment metagenome TaxID=412755 RepID=A0A0F9NGB9_9ZZZZ